MTTNTESVPISNEPSSEPQTKDDSCLGCHGESHYGAHGIRNGEIYDEYWCESCYHKKDTKSTKDVTHEDPVCGRPTPEDNEIRTSQEVPDLVEQYYQFYKARLSGQPGRHV